MNPILCAESDSDTSGLLYTSSRGRGDGELSGENEDTDSGVRASDESGEVTGPGGQAEEDSDFDDFDSEGETEDPGETSIEVTQGSQNNEIEEIYFVQDSKQTRVIGKESLCR